MKHISFFAVALCGLCAALSASGQDSTNVVSPDTLAVWESPTAPGTVEYHRFALTDPDGEPEADGVPIMAMSAGAGQALPAIPYTHDVTATGAYTLNVPIDVFPGVNGMQPNVALVYNSQAGNGVVGYGWGLSGLSTIAGRPKNLYYDGKVEATSISSFEIADFPLTLDGQKLIYINQLTNNGTTATAEFKLETTNAVKVIVQFEILQRWGSSSVYLLQSATVYHPDGKVAEYALLKNQLVLGLTKLTDKNGNTINYSYVDDATSLRIAGIQYGGNSAANTGPFAQVNFEYHERADKNTVYEVGRSFTHHHLLTAIKVVYNGATLRTYTLTYQLRRSSQLTNIALQSGSSQYSPLVLSYNPQSVYYFSSGSYVPRYFWPDGHKNNLSYFSCRYYPGSPGDQDVVVSMPKKELYTTNNGSGYGDDDIVLFTPRGGERIKTELHFRGIVPVDLKGVGYGQLVKINAWREGNKEVSKFTIYDHSGAVTTRTCEFGLYSDDDDSIIPRLFLGGDFDGDGRQEIFGANAWELKSNKDGVVRGGYIFNLNTPTLQPIAVGNNHVLYRRGDMLYTIDYDGDGKTDIAHINGSTGRLNVYTFVKNETGGDWPYTLQSTGGAETPFRAGDKILLGDINGDGKTDFFKYSLSSSQNNVHCIQLLSTGAGYFTKKEYSFALPMTVNQFIMSDLNNDGKSDLAFFSQNDFYVYYSDGEQISSAGRRAAQNMNFGNANGILTVTENHLYTDNRAERYVSHIYQNKVTLVNFTSDERESALLKSSTSKGVTVNAQYKRWDRDETYPAPEVPASQYPYQTFKAPLWVASKVSSAQLKIDDTYTYTLGVLHRQGLGFCGFQEIARTDNRGRLFTKIFDPFRFGVPVSEDSPVAATGYTYVTERLADKSLKITLSEKTTTDKLTGVSTLTRYLYDDYNNPTWIGEASSGYSRETVINYINQTNGRWLIGLPIFTHVANTRGNSNKWDELAVMEYDANYNVASIVKSKGVPTSVLPVYTTQYFAYDGFGNVIAQGERPYTSSLVRYSQSTYSPHGFLMRTEDDRNNITEYAYDEKGLLMSETSYNSLVTGSSSRFTRMTLYGYDGYGRSTVAVYNGGMRTKNITYRANEESPYGDYIETTEQGAAGERLYTDAAGRELKRQTQAFDGSWITATTAYDAFGRVSETNTPAGKTTYTYDNFDRITSIREPTGSTTSYSYSGLSTTETKDGQSTTTTRNVLGEVVSITDPTGTISYTLRADGQPERVDANGVVTTFTYDNYGRQTAIHDPSAGKVEYFYNAEGLPAKQINAKGQQTTMTYDNYGQLTSKKSGATVNYEYRHDGLPTRITDGTHTLQYSYDVYDRPLAVIETISGRRFITQYGYQGHLLSRKFYPLLSYEVQYEYNERGDLAYTLGFNTMTGALVSGKAMEHTPPDEYGSVSAFIYANNAKEMRAYNRHGMQTDWELSEGAPPFDAPAKRYGERYSYDAAQNLLLQRSGTVINYTPTNGMISGPLLISAVDNFEYDDYKRLTHHNSSCSNCDEFGYLNNGNITYKTGTGNYTYSSSRPYAVESITGNEGSVSSTMQDVIYNTYIMRPSSIHEGDYVAFFNYGVNGERHTMTVLRRGIKQFTRYYFAGGAYEETDYETGYTYTRPFPPTLRPILKVELTPQIVLDPINVVENSNNYSFSLLANMQETGQTYRDRILYVDGSPYRAAIAYTPDRQNKHFYIHRDRQGSVRAISNEMGMIVARYFYDAWGRQTDECGTPYAPYREPMLLLGRGYTGHEHLPWFNLINMNARLYNPAVGRFLSPDPYVIDPGYLQDFNRYTYARNNPLMYTDENGEFIIGLISGFIRGLIQGHSNPFKTAWDTGVNELKIIGGLFTSDLRKANFWDQSWEILSRFTWQLPQTIAGNAFSNISNWGWQVDHVDYWGGATVLSGNYFGQNGAVTLGSYINGNRNLVADPNNYLFQHEYGHYLQSQKAGWAYLGILGLPSLISAAYDTPDNAYDHSDFFAEQNANKEAYGYFYGKMGSDLVWNFGNNPINDANWVNTVQSKYVKNQIQTTTHPLPSMTTFNHFNWEYAQQGFGDYRNSKYRRKNSSVKSLVKLLSLYKK